MKYDLGFYLIQRIQNLKINYSNTSYRLVSFFLDWVKNVSWPCILVIVSFTKTNSMINGLFFSNCIRTLNEPFWTKKIFTLLTERSQLQSQTCAESLVSRLMKLKKRVTLRMFGTA